MATSLSDAGVLATEVSAAATVTRGVMADDHAVLEWRWNEPAWPRAMLVISYNDGASETHPIDPSASTQASCRIDGDRIVDSVGLYAEHHGKRCRMEYDPAHFFLDRLLSRDIKQVNANLRWQGRIDDFPTRAFAARNSYRFHASNPAVAVYCLVSVGYTALERLDQADMRFVFDALRHVYTVQMDEIHGEARLSTLAHLLHYAIYFLDKALFEQVAQDSLRALPDLEAEPNGSFNAMVMVILCGLYFRELGKTELASKHFSHGDRVFRIAAKGYSRNLNMYRELSTIGNRAYLAAVGHHVSQGRQLNPELGLKMFDGWKVAGEVCRLRTPAACKELAARLKTMVDQHTPTQAKRSTEPC
jgi:hypothetical protein